jgi:hypothetical protein
MNWKNRYSLPVFTLFFTILLLPQAKAGIIHFDELGVGTEAPANGLSVGGVLFGFNLGGTSSDQAIFGAAAPFNDSILQDFVLSGPARDSLDNSAAATLTFDFAQPSSVLAFGLAVSTTLDATITLEQLDDQMNALAPVVIPLTYDHVNCTDPPATTCFAEVQYTYAGSNLLSRATLNFAGVNADLFALDNLQTLEAPEPSSAMLLGLGLLLVLFGSVRKARLSIKA